MKRRAIFVHAHISTERRIPMKKKNNFAVLLVFLMLFSAFITTLPRVNSFTPALSTEKDEGGSCGPQESFMKDQNCAYCVRASDGESKGITDISSLPSNKTLTHYVRLPTNGNRFCLTENDKIIILQKCINLFTNFDKRDLINKWKNATIKEVFLEYNVLLEEIHWITSVYGNQDCIGILALDSNGELAWVNPNVRKSIEESRQEAISLLSHYTTTSKIDPKLMIFGGKHYWFLDNYLEKVYLVELFSESVIQTSPEKLLSTAKRDEPAPPGAQGNTEIQPDTVPWFDQGARSWCCPYSTTMMLAWWGYEPAINNHDQCAHDIARIGQGRDPPDVDEGVFVGCAAHAVSQLTGFQTVWHGQMKDIWSCDDTSPHYIDDLKDMISNGYIVAIEVDCDGSSATTNDLHISLIIGYDDTDEFVCVHDPSGAWTGWGGDTFASYTNLESRWGAWDSNWPLAGFPDKDSPSDWFPHYHKHLGMVLYPGDWTLINPSCGLTSPPSTINYGETLTLTASLSCSGQSADYSGIHVRVSGGNVIGYSTSDFTGHPYDTNANPTSLPAPIVEFERSSMDIGTTYTAIVTLEPSTVGTMYVYYRGWATDINDKVHCNYYFSQINPWQTRHHTTTVYDDSSSSPISMPRVEGWVQRDPTSWADDRWCGSYKFTWYDCKSHSVTVTGSSISITETLNPSTSPPSGIVQVYGTATFDDGSPVSHTDVTITITQTGASWTTTTDASGYYSRYISAPGSGGTYTVRVDVSSGELSGWNSKTLTVQSLPGGTYYTLYRTTTCKDVQPSSPYDPIGETEVFRTSDAIAYTWIHLTYVYRSLNVKWEWYDPNGNYQTQCTGTIPDPGAGSYWEWYKTWCGIYINGYSPQDVEGRWISKVYIDEGSGYQLQATEDFVIRYEVTGRTMAKDVQTYDPYEPIDPTDSFMNTDPKALAWVRLDEVAESLEIKWEWREPSGAIYSTAYWTTEDPGSTYWDWYKAWCYIDIYGHSPQSKLGQWEVRAYIKDVYGNWDLEYSQYFTISDNTPPGTPGTPVDDGDYSTSGTVTWTWTAAPEDGAVAQYQIQVGTTLGGNDFFDGLVGTELSKTLSGLPDGFTYYARVRAMNTVGQWGPWSGVSDGITVDTIPPDTTIDHSPGSLSVSLSASDAASGVAFTYYRIDSGSWSTYSGTFVLTGNGSHVIDYYSRDNAGNNEPIHTLVVHYLTPNTDPSGLDAPTGQGWYDYGTNASVSVSSVPGYLFEYWYLDGQAGIPYSTSMSTKIIMDNPHVATAKFARPRVHNVNTGFNYTTIQKAIDAPETLAGHTIYVETGTYYEHIVVDKSLAIVGLDMETTVVDGNSTGNVIKVVASDVTIANLTVRNSGSSDYNCGVYLYFTGNCTVTQISAYQCRCGIGLYHSIQNGITNNTLSDNYLGIAMLFDSSENRIVGNNLVSDVVYMQTSCEQNILSHNNISSSAEGIVLHECNNNNITDNYVWNSSSNAIRLHISDSNLFDSNIVIDSSVGLFLFDSVENTIIHNRIQSNSGHGIYLQCSSNNTMSENYIRNNDNGIRLIESSNYNSVLKNNITDNSYGIYLHEGLNNTIFGNTIANNYYGIRPSDSSNTTISRNTITSNSVHGVYLQGSLNNRIYRNNITSNNDNGLRLIGSSNYNAIYGNNITNNGVFGIYIHGSVNNTICENNISVNEHGIRFYDSSSNLIYHNYFQDNAIQASTYNSTNIWNNGYPSGGNCWSNYTGLDELSGPYQNETGSDGILDHPYVIDGNNQDNYPLTKPYRGTHDIGITNITTSKTVVGQGYNLSITVKILNYGINTETFSITAYTNTTIISTFESITLTSRNSTTITFAWNTTDVPYGNYTISAYATLVPGETDTTDNDKTDGWVFVTILGDINGDKVVDSADKDLLDIAWGSQIGESNYIPEADLNDDGVVDSTDYGILGVNWGHSWS